MEGRVGREGSLGKGRGVEGRIGYGMEGEARGMIGQRRGCEGRVG